MANGMCMVTNLIITVMLSTMKLIVLSCLPADLQMNPRRFSSNVIAATAKPILTVNTCYNYNIIIACLYSVLSYSHHTPLKVHS